MMFWTKVKMAAAALVAVMAVSAGTVAAVQAVGDGNRAAAEKVQPRPPRRVVAGEPKGVAKGKEGKASAGWSKAIDGIAVRLESVNPVMQGGANPQRAALPLGVLCIGLMLGLSRLKGRREEEPADTDTDADTDANTDTEVTP